MLIKNGQVSFIEVKAAGQKPTELQTKRKQELKSFGCSVRCATVDDQDVEYNELKTFDDLGF